MDDTQPGYYRYWGKAKQSNDGGGEPYHLLVYHSLDVAAVGQVLLSKNRFLLNRLADLMQLSTSQAQQHCVFLLGVHDLGKFAEPFQYLKPELRQDFWPQHPAHFKNYSVRHDSLGQMLWEQCIKKSIIKEANDEDLKNFINEEFKFWMQAVTGHHGHPPNTKEQARRHFSKHDQDAGLAFFNDWKQLLNIDLSALIEEKTTSNSNQQNHASWLLAGIAVLCDWLGSGQDNFKYHTENCELSLSEYWEQVALPTAEKAINAVGLLPSTVKQDLRLNELFNYIEQPTPLQDKCAELTFNTSPQLFILEDVTGAGKTEAALMLAHRMISQDMAEGFYIGLPTMATANAMYERMATSYLKFYQEGEAPSLILSHSARHLSKQFRQSLLSAQQGAVRYQSNEESISAQCNRWLADNRKKALLADVGIGTIDQALLGVLPVRHQSLRLLGLINKVLILDEVHAYDAYTGELLRTLVKFHSTLGGSIILLSATLTCKQREKLAQSFGAVNFTSQKNDTYPLLTRISSTGDSEEIALQTREAVKREVGVEFLHDEAKVLEHIQWAVSEGLSVCWIRNTVPDARAAFAALQTHITEGKLHLFHSRYTLHDRLQIEEQVLELFGKNSTPEQRRGRVLIATQVVEQSLDLDFDVMISDLAPVDLLIQRAGRLQRHNRDKQGSRLPDGQPDQRGKPILTVHSPQLTDTPQDGWYKALFPKADFVYPHTLVLWRTAKILEQQKGWFMPADQEGKRGARSMLEFVYDEDGDVPEGLDHRTNEAIADAMSKSDAGDFATLKPESGYRINHHWDEEANHVTRLGEETNTVYLARWQNDVLSPWIDEGYYRWDLSSVRISHRQLAGCAPITDEALSSALSKLKAEEKLFDEDSVIIVLLMNEEKWEGEGINEKGRTISILYNTLSGLELFIE